jgi:hypothetical protein
MIRKQFLFLLFSFFLQNGFGQIVFNKTNDLNSTNQNKIIATKDGGYLVIGSYLDYYRKTFIAKINNYGDTVWTKKSFQGSFICVVEAEDGNFVLSGYAGSTTLIDGDQANATLFLCKVHSTTGELIWQKYYDQFGQGYSAFYDLKMTNNGYILCGHHTVYNDQIEDLEYLSIIVKTNLEGTINWDKQFTDTSYYSTAFSIEETDNKDFLLLRSDQKLVKLNAFGDTVWTKVFPHQYGKIVKLQDNNFIIAGQKYVTSDTTEAILSKITPEGEIIWQKSFREKYNSTSITDVKQKENGNLIFTENVSNKFSNPDQHFLGYLKEINLTTGVLSWEKSFFYYNTDTVSNAFRSIALSNDGGIIICGRYYYKENNISNGGDWLVKTDCQGNDTFWDYAACSENLEVELTIFPNPTSTVFTAVTIEENIAEIFLYNTLGELVFSEKPNKKFASINIENQSDGIYNCVVTTESNKQISRKVVVMR